ncbi:MAG: lipoyl domain-containing protein [Planctomycetaceae bacterium]
MNVPITLSELGAEGEPVRVSVWLVDVGDALSEGDRVVEVLLRGITFDVSAPVGGVLRRIDKNADSVVAAGDVLGWIDPDGPIA